MANSITVYKMYKYRLYRNDKRDKALRHKLFVSSLIWNHFIALQRRYFRLTGNYMRDRVFVCECGVKLDRDQNAAINILCVGTSTPYRSDSKTKVKLRSRHEGRRPRL